METIDKQGTELFQKYISQYKDEVKHESSENYFHVDVVLDAYSKGLSDGKAIGEKDFMTKLVKNQIEKFVQKSNQIYILSQNIISTLNKEGYKVSALYIDITPNRPSVILTVSNDLLLNDEFVKLSYSKLFENREMYFKLFDEMLDIGLVSADNLDTDLLTADGFGYKEHYEA